MRRITAVLLMLLLMVPAGDAGAETATRLRFDIESRYHVSVLMGEECASVPTSGFTLQIIPKSISVFNWLYHGEDQYAEVLHGLDMSLSAYPQDFLKGLKSAAGETARLQFVIGDRIVRGGQTYGGMTASDNAGHSSVFLAVEAADVEASVHHAIWYAMEARILFRAPLSLKDWTDLNPNGFAYEEEESILPEAAVDPDDWFVSEASRQNEEEDRATVFEAYMTRESSWWNTRPHLQAKLKFLLQRIQGVFRACPEGRK